MVSPAPAVSEGGSLENGKLAIYSKVDGRFDPHRASHLVIIHFLLDGRSSNIRCIDNRYTDHECRASIRFFEEAEIGGAEVSDTGGDTPSDIAFCLWLGC